jgi:predicted nucleotidyltransferase
METTVLAHREEIDQICRHFHVSRLELFGSALRADFSVEESDLDFLVEFAADSAGQYADNYFGLKEALEGLLQRPVDLVSATAIRNPYFREAIEREKALLYAA